MLTEKWIHRSHALASLLSDIPIDSILSSPLQRCIDTISPLADSHNIEIQIDTRLTEFYLGPMQWKSWNDVSSEYNYQLHDIHWEKQEDCEHMTEVMVRLKDFLRSLQKQYSDDSTVVICTHSWVILYLLSIIDDTPPKNWLNFLSSNSWLSHKDAYILRAF